MAQGRRRKKHDNGAAPRIHILDGVPIPLLHDRRCKYLEWTRRTVIDRNFYVGLSGEVPGALCEAGPYHYVRHPFYLSYMTAFVAAAVAFPSLIVSGVCALNIGFFVYMAFDDERVLLRSAIAADYRNYGVRVGRFVPRFAAKRSQAK